MCVERGRNVFTAKASISRGRLLPVLQGAAPLPIRIGPWEKGVCFGNVVARDGHSGITLLPRLDENQVAIECDP